MKKIVKMTLFHCARGSGCAKCDALAAQGPKFTLVELQGSQDEIARPMIEVEIEGEVLWMDFDIIKSFENEAEANAYSKEHSIEIISNE